MIRRVGVLFVATPVLLHPVMSFLGDIGFHFTRMEVREITYTDAVCFF